MMKFVRSDLYYKAADKSYKFEMDDLTIEFSKRYNNFEKELNFSYSGKEFLIDASDHEKRLWIAFDEVSLFEAYFSHFQEIIDQIEPNYESDDPLEMAIERRDHEKWRRQAAQVAVKNIDELTLRLAAIRPKLAAFSVSND